MKDSIEFYVEFIAEIEKNPILYNHTLNDYSNRRITEIIWTKIGEKFNEKGDDCKSKWKSIRSAYIRALNTKSKSGSAAGSKKEYYLAPYLKFLNPFTKHRQQEGNISVQEDEQLTEHESQIEETSNNVPDLTCAEGDSLRNETLVASVPSPAPSPHSSSLSIQTSQPAKSRKPMSEADKCTIEYIKLKKQRLENNHQSEKQPKDPCEMFLLSLVPHMTSMSQQQQLTFQRGVLELIENIKYRQLPRGSLDTNSSNSNLSTYYTNFSQVLHDDRPLQRATEIAQSENQYMRPPQAPYTNPHSENESVESPAQQLNETSQSESQYLIY
ncbi:unnamed protein product [Callosobruchus maculatus]|uniref:Uncharacterized protein n=1 Tax=Callosobruchus maculatus TaxID=64391 RepID=A0A653BJJ1_CALMS|nr:unnamed protein product [Callosobruchus maculatus]